MLNQLITLDHYCSKKTTVYGQIVNGGGQTSFEIFLRENLPVYREEIKEIHQSIQSIGRYGAREYFFRKKNEGKYGDGVCALFDERDALLRLYCIRYSNEILILGGGGVKSKSIRTWQDSPKLSEEVNRMIELSAYIRSGISNGLISIKDNKFILLK